MGTEKARQKDRNKAIEHYLSSVPGKNTVDFTEHGEGYITGTTCAKDTAIICLKYVKG